MPASCLQGGGLAVPKAARPWNQTDLSLYPAFIIYQRFVTGLCCASVSDLKDIMSLWKGSVLPRVGNSVKLEVKLAQLCLTLGDPMDFSHVSPWNSVHGIHQARTLE